MLDWIKTTAAVVCTIAAPMLLCDDVYLRSPLKTMESYGWRSRTFGSGGRAIFIIFAGLLLVVGFVDAIQLALTLRSKKPTTITNDAIIRDAHKPSR
jgi:hypothetical protein